MRLKHLLQHLTLAIGLSGVLSAAADPKQRLLIYGASGRIGGAIVEEALTRGYQVTGVSRNVDRLAAFGGRIDVAQGNILDRQRTAELAASHDAIIVSVGGKPVSSDPNDYIAATAAQSLIEVLSQQGEAGPRVIFVGNLFTLIYEDGKTLLELDRVPQDHPNLAMFHGHQIALDRFRKSQNVNWTVATPPNGLRLKGRTGQVRWGSDTLLRDADGTPSTISREDFAFAVLEELAHGRYLRQRFNTAR